MNKLILLAALTLFISGIFIPAALAAKTPADNGTHYFSELAKGMKAPAWQQSKNRGRVQARHNSAEKLLCPRIGTPETFHTFNFATNSWEQTEATLVSCSENFLIYLENNNRRGKEVDLKKLSCELENRIYPTTTRYFGSENRPGVDDQTRITILLMDIRDNAAKGNSYTSGYFNRGDCYRPDELPADSTLKSNQREMLYLDTDPSEVNSSEFFATIAHELQHLIHFHHDPEEYDWVDEGCAQINTWFCGYGHPRQISAYQKTPDNSLVAWSPWNQVANYGQTYLWNLFLVSRYLGTDADCQHFFKELVASRKTGADSFNSALKNFNTSFVEAFSDFCIAGFLNQPCLTPQTYTFGSLLEDFRLPDSAFYKSYPAMITDSVSLWGADMFKFDLAAAGSRIRIDFAGALTNLDNEFTVIAVFVNEAEKKIVGRFQIDNIKSTTRHRRSISRVMLPGQNNGDYGYPAPPPVKTQMGHMEIDVPAEAGVMNLVVIGRTPPDIEDSMLVWSGKATYRVDVRSVGATAATAPASTATAVRSDLLKLYADLSRDVSVETLEQRAVQLESLHKQILNDVNIACDAGNTTLADNYLAEIAVSTEPALSALQRDLQAIKLLNSR